MAAALHLSDSSRSTRSHKLLTLNKRPQGFEAPRNSLEFPPESYQGYHEIYEDIPFSCIIKNPSRRTINPSGTPAKELIDEEMSSKVNCRRNAPSVVARLMGMDSLPPEALNPSTEGIAANSRNNEQRYGSGEADSAQFKPFTLDPFGLQRDGVFLSKNVSTAAATISPWKGKQHKREHPQEEQLQKFKEEFEAWQSNKKWEQNKNVRLDGSPPGLGEHHTFPKGKKSEDKMVSCGNGQQKIFHRKASRLSDFDNRMQRVEFYHDITTVKYPSNLVKPAPENRMQWRNVRGIHVEENVGKLDESLPTANIVILKPNAEYIDDFRETWANSPEIVEKVGSIEHFLEEVKERLRLEVQGRHIHVPSPSSIEGPLRKGKRTDPKRIAQHIARQIRESISRDIETALMRSKSMRLSNKEERCRISDSSERIGKEYKNTFLKRLKNAQNTMEGNEFSLDSSGRGNAQIFAKKVIRLFPTSDHSPVNDLSSCNTSSWLKVGRRTSFGFEQEKDATFSRQPIPLSRSYSAPTSGAAFGNLYIVDGVHIRRDHGSNGSVSETMRERQRDGFNFKNKVSYLRHNLTLKHKLFNKKSPLEEQSIAPQLDSEETASTALPMNIGTAMDNLTEVPPSPVSISSSSPDDFFKHASPVSPLDVPFSKEHSSPQSCEGIASSIPDQSPSRLIEDVASEVPSSHVRAYEDVVLETCSHEEIFIHEVLLTAGLYQKDLSSVTSPNIPSWVFEKVVNIYHNPNVFEGCSTREAIVSHKMLFDLLNEALDIVLQPRNTRVTIKWPSSMPRKIPQGNKLLCAVWHEMSNLTPCFTGPYVTKNLVAHDIRKNTWSAMVEEERDALRDDVASMILEQLLDGLLN